ncbi:MBL fold metallo-hydrolase [Aeromicrobium sp. CF3.5]|uniref:MBL fold metallo-hydrolase n=1 Tax=Aeromicrobium sp. CF3.5 TaxID=3373078 RepID=UPI003EE4A2B9
MSTLAVTWWGHSSASIELGAATVGTDPLLTDRLAHLVRHAPTPPAHAREVDVVVISHLHGDHLHLASLQRLDPAIPLVVPRGAAAVMKKLRQRTILEVEPGDRLDVSGVRVDVRPAHHDGHRLPRSRAVGPALGFVLESGGHRVWYPGDTGDADHLRSVGPVDLALVPIGGWGPSLGDEHLGPEQAADVAVANQARWALPVHHGTFWPWGLRRVARGNHERLFIGPAGRFAVALEDRPTTALPAVHGRRIVLSGDES